MPNVGRVYMDYTAIEHVMQLPVVRQQIAHVADRVAANARDVAAGARMGGLPIGREDGTRPKGRPYARVTAPLGQEYGSGSMTRLAILASAVARL